MTRSLPQRRELCELWQHAQGMVHRPVELHRQAARFFQTLDAVRQVRPEQLQLGAGEAFHVVAHQPQATAPLDQRQLGLAVQVPLVALALERYGSALGGVLLHFAQVVPPPEQPEGESARWRDGFELECVFCHNLLQV